MATETRLKLKDVCCGRGGWTKGFMAQGFECVGYDLNPQPEYPGGFVQKNVLDMTLEDVADADFLVASTPCENFSIHCMPHFHPNPKHPELGIKLFNHTRDLFERSGKPYIMENVRCAEKFVGKAVNHCGPFYLWGNAVPATFPPDCYRFTKGFQLGGAIIQKLKGINRQALTEYRRQNDLSWSSSKSEKRREMTARAAEIPLELSGYIAKCAMSLLSEFPVPPYTDEVASGVE